jgi:TPR repeat protein/serine/threonine protein kinase
MALTVTETKSLKADSDSMKKEIEKRLTVNNLQVVAANNKPFTPKTSSESMVGDDGSMTSNETSVNSDSQNTLVLDRLMASRLIHNEPLSADQAAKRMKMLNMLRLSPEDVLISSIKLGQGGFGDVYLGNFKRKSKCAIKTVQNIDNPHSDEKRKTIENELLLMKYLGAYHVLLPCYGYVLDKNNFHIVLEYAPYGSLDRLLRETTLEEFPLSLVIAWLTDVADALNFLHQREIMHRDMKAENMLLFERLSIKLCDFGPAKHHLSSVTADDNSGTICFLAPEVRIGQVAELSADIFTFAMVAIQIMTRKNPKIDNFKSQVIEALMKTTIPNPNVNRKLHALLTNCIAYDANVNPANIRPNSQHVFLTLKDILENDLGGDPRKMGDSHSLSQVIKDIEVVAYMKQSERLKQGSKASNGKSNNNFFRPQQGKKNLKSFSCDQYESASFQKAEFCSANWSTYSAVSRNGNGEVNYSATFTGINLTKVSMGGSPSLGGYSDSQMAEEKNQMVKYLRNEVKFTLSNAIRTAEILIRNGVLTMQVLRRRLVRNRDFLLDIGVDDDAHYDILEHMINTAKDQAEIDNLRSSKRYSQRLAANADKGENLAKLPTETSRLYYEASQCNRSESLMALKDLAETGDKLAECYLMRMYALGQGGMKKDRKKAVEIGKRLFPWLQDCVSKGTDLLVMFARYLIGVCYSEGLGIRQDLREAIRWYKLSSSQGYSAAQAYLGYCYFTGLGIPRNLDEAIRYYKLAAELGHAGAQCNLGLCYEHGYGVAKDKENAVKWYRHAADQGDSAAIYNLGYCYERGFGVEENIREAVKYYKAAAGAGYTAAQHNLGLCYYFGNGVEQNIEEAVVWLRLSAEKGYAPAQCKLGLCYENGHGVHQDFREAVYWYRQSAEQGDAAALYYLGFCYFSGTGVDVSYEDAVRYYKESATKNYPPALNNLGFCYFNGMGLPKNYTMAVKYYRQSAELGYAPAQYNMGYCYEKGFGVVKKLNTVIKWYRLAAENGNEKAKRELAKYQAL